MLESGLALVLPSVFLAQFADWLNPACIVAKILQTPPISAVFTTIGKVDVTALALVRALAIAMSCALQGQWRLGLQPGVWDWV